MWSQKSLAKKLKSVDLFLRIKLNLVKKLYLTVLFRVRASPAQSCPNFRSVIIREVQRIHEEFFLENGIAVDAACPYRRVLYLAGLFCGCTEYRKFC
jgi:hypothetical protein